jgi:hypothetical protein
MRDEPDMLPAVEQMDGAADALDEALTGRDGELTTPLNGDADLSLVGEEDEDLVDQAVLPQLQAEFRRLSAPLAAFTKVKASDPKHIERLDVALKRLPPGEAVGQTLDELRERMARYVEAARRERIQAFRPLEAEYVRDARADGKSLRERANGWRVDLLELQLQREQARARYFYNREALAPWSPVGAAADLAALEAKARALLARAALPEATLRGVFQDAFDYARDRRRPARASQPERVPLPDFYRAVRVMLVQHELAEGQPEKKLRYGELPRWAFLYNLDRYRALGAELALQTGSQQESRQFGLVVNGLDAQQDYKTMCYILPATPAVKGAG